jgi:trans-2,3-dihydro-3-hydroxyanthranilate isomerase
MVRAGAGRAVFDAPALPVESGAAEPEAVASALGLARSEVGFENHQPTVFSAGSHPFAFVPVRNLGTVAQAKPQAPFWDKAFPEGRGCYVYTRESVGLGRRFHARSFVPALGIAEDPATGAAAAAFAGVVNKFDAMPAGWHEITIEQGFEMGRPSLMTLEMEVEAGALRQVRIGGEAVIVARGDLSL